jgi:hypothetical protein
MESKRDAQHPEGVEVEEVIRPRKMAGVAPPSTIDTGYA